MLIINFRISFSQFCFEDRIRQRGNETRDKALQVETEATTVLHRLSTDDG